MLLKIGKLGKHTGLTARATPLRRHRPAHAFRALRCRLPLYNRTDIARLHHIEALRKFGLSLAEIGAYLARPDLPLATVVAQQIAILTRQIDQANILRARLSDLHQQLAQG
jgi:hypothetical protein